jgi:hypothetical protein
MDFQNIEIDFRYKNDIGIETKVSRSIPEPTLQTDFELLVEEFKNFLKAVGFTNETVEKVQIVEEE